MNIQNVVECYTVGQSDDPDPCVCKNILIQNITIFQSLKITLCDKLNILVLMTVLTIVLSRFISPAHVDAQIDFTKILKKV